MNLLRTLAQRAYDYYQREPARVHGVVVSAVIALAAAVGVVLDVGTVTGIVVAVAPLVVAELTRSKVFAPATVDELTAAEVHADDVHVEAGVEELA